MARFLQGLLAACLFSFAAHGATPGVSAGGTQSLAVHADGTVRAWGDDSAGSLGLGRSLASPAPALLAGLTDVTAVAAGNYHTLALRADGTVWAWGWNAVGQLGDGTTASRSTPAPVPGLSGIVEIAAGEVHNVARASDGTVWTWGSNYTAALGDERSGGGVPERVAAMSGVVAIAAGGQHTLVVRNDGTVWAWGRNDFGQLGDGTTTHRLVPVQVAGVVDIVQVGAARASFALKRDGTMWGWGSNGYGQLGDDTFEDRPRPVQLLNLTSVASFAVNILHAAAVKTDGSLWTWGGDNSYGQLGDGSTERRTAAVPSVLTTGISRVAVGAFHSIAVGTDRRVRTWGNNSSGQLGNGVRVFASAPVTPAITGIAQVAAGGRHAVALKSDGTVLAAGNNEGFQLGDETRDNRSTFAPVRNLTDVVQVSAGFFHSMARKADGTLWAWGYNDGGRLGVGEGINTPVPVQVDSLSNMTQVSAGGGHTLALRADGTVWAWGDNVAGQLGDGTTTTRFRPVRVEGLSGIAEVAAGWDHSLARGTDGAVYAWGSNHIGQLGIGSNSDRLRPALVTGLPPITSIAAGGSISAATAAGGSVWVWGANYLGQLGDGTEQEQNAPVRLEGVTGVVQLSIGEGHTLARLADGSILSWGINEYGQLGDGTLANRPRPVVVVREGGAGTIAANDWFLDLDPATPTTIPVERTPVFLALTRGSGNSVTADIKVRAQDVGSSASTFVFALAPSTIVQGAAAVQGSEIGIKARGAPKNTVACALAQLNAQGQLVAVSAASLQAYASGVLSATAQSVAILNNVPTSNVAGATFYVGYGANGDAMLVNGTTRSVVSVPAGVSCRPQAPQTGWWWNPAEDGRGYSLERYGNNLFFASFLYDASGRSTWYYAAGRTSLDGALFTGELLEVRGGQTLGGPYNGFPSSLRSLGPITLLFANPSEATMSWPGGNVPIQRFNIIPNGLAAGPAANMPESGWWWNEQESGRGFFLEWQENTLNVAGYMYDDGGNPVWYLAFGPTSGDGRSFSSTWWSFGNGMTLAGPWRQHARVNDNVAPVTISFTSATTATMTLPNGRTTALARHRF